MAHKPRKCAQKWTVMLSTTFIKIVHDMWIHRNDVLRQKDNIVTDIDHKRINEQNTKYIQGTAGKLTITNSFGG